MLDLTFGEQVKIILRHDDQRTRRNDRRADREKDVQAESYAAPWKR